MFLDPNSTNAQTNFYNEIDNNNKKYISQVQPLVHRYPTYEVSITPKTAFSTEFYCHFWKSTKNMYSNHAPVTVTEPVTTPTPLPVTPSTPTSLPSTPSTPTPSPIPQITLTSNESTVHINHPFTVTCTISNFENSGKKYLVNYFNNRNGLLASYEVDGTKNA